MMIMFDWGVALLCLLGAYFVFFIAHTIFDLTDTDRIAKRKAERRSRRPRASRPAQDGANDASRAAAEPEVPSFNAARRSLVE
jgi:hypothetical protein